MVADMAVLGAVAGGTVTVALAAFRIIDKFASKKTNGKVPDGFYGRMDALHDIHLGTAAIDGKSGTPRWWGNRAVSVLEDIKDLIEEGGDARLKQEILRYLHDSDTASTELAEKYMQSLSAQTEVLTRIAERYENCDYCRDAATE